MATAPVKTSIGCSELERQCDFDQAKEFVKICIEHGVYDFDTAYVYSGGKCEEIMGNIDCLHDPKMFIATKAAPWSEKGLKYDRVLEQLNESLKRLKKDCVELFYLHAPDHNTPIEETLEAVNHLYKEGKFKYFGISNYASWEVAEIYYLCKMNNYPLPTFYQGMYNPLTRDVEKELFPCLRRFGIAFYAYNPLAGGLLTGKHRFEDRANDKIQHGRFGGASQWTDLYLKRYWKKPLFDAIDKLKETLDRVYGEGKVTLVDATLRWMYHHSKMDGAHGGSPRSRSARQVGKPVPGVQIVGKGAKNRATAQRTAKKRGENGRRARGACLPQFAPLSERLGQATDTVIIGASSVKHLEENLKSTKNGPLHEDVVKVFEEVWEETKADCIAYFR